MLPGASAALKSLYWGYRRNPRLIGHRLHVLMHFVLTWAQLWLIRIVHFRRELVVIGLVESMGDIVASEPIAREARRRFPNGHIVWVVRPAFIELVERFEAVDQGLAVTCVTEWMLLIAFRPPCTMWNLHIDNASCSLCRSPLPQLGEAAGITLDTYYGLGNLLAVNCRCAGIPVLDETPRLDPGAAATRAVDALSLPSRFVVMHCVSNDFNRNWRPEHWDGLAAFIHDDLGWEVVEIGLKPVTSGARSGQYVNLCGQLSIPQMAEVIRRASLFIGIDSGPAHFANAVGTPGVLIFGHFIHWAKYMSYSGWYENGGGADILWADGPAANLPLAEVEAAVEKRIGRAERSATSASR